MFETTVGQAAIVDYGMGNLFSVKHACTKVGLTVSITSSLNEISQADALILPGVGAFGDAMTALHSRDLVQPIRDFAASGKLLVGICLGLQLLFSESHEFGYHKGMGLIEGSIERLETVSDGITPNKVPQVGWNQISVPDHLKVASGWLHSPLSGLKNGTYMYFVHSYYAKPVNLEAVLSYTRYGNTSFCSSVCVDNIVAFQFHPERSGVSGLSIYSNLAMKINNQVNGVSRNEELKAN